MNIDRILRIATLLALLVIAAELWESRQSPPQLAQYELKLVPMHKLMDPGWEPLTWNAQEGLLIRRRVN